MEFPLLSQSPGTQPSYNNQLRAFAQLHPELTRITRKGEGVLLPEEAEVLIAIVQAAELYCANLTKRTGFTFTFGIDLKAKGWRSHTLYFEQGPRSGPRTITEPCPVTHPYLHYCFERITTLGRTRLEIFRSVDALTTFEYATAFQLRSNHQIIAVFTSYRPPPCLHHNKTFTVERSWCSRQAPVAFITSAVPRARIVEGPTSPSYENWLQTPRPYVSPCGLPRRYFGLQGLKKPRNQPSK
jgi:hypothetical protein